MNAGKTAEDSCGFLKKLQPKNMADLTAIKAAIARRTYPVRMARGRLIT
jgi:hypothetical protein